MATKHFSKEEAFAVAQQRANDTRRRFDVYEHVGDYGRPGGDIEATHDYMVRSSTLPPPASTWAFIATADPQ